MQINTEKTAWVVFLTLVIVGTTGLTIRGVNIKHQQDIKENTWEVIDAGNVQEATFTRFWFGYEYYITINNKTYKIPEDIYLRVRVGDTVHVLMNGINDIKYEIISEA